MFATWCSTARTAAKRRSANWPRCVENWDYSTSARHNRSAAVSVRCSVVSPEVDPENGITVNALYRQLDEILHDEYGFNESGDNVSFIGQFNTESQGIRARYAGSHEEMVKDFGYLATSMILASLLVTSVLIVQFNSIRQTAIVLVAIPLSFVGVVTGMWICDFPFSLFSFIGLISLAGVVVNDAIVIVDFTNRGREEGKGIHDALLAAGRDRFRPVMLTTVTTIGGMLPLFVNVTGGAEFWQPLAGAVIFGLTVSTGLTLVVIPVMYSLVYRAGGEAGRQEEERSVARPPAALKREDPCLVHTG